jgi:hypothetical protein
MLSPPDKSPTRLCGDCKDKPQYWDTYVPIYDFRVGDYGSYISDYLSPIHPREHHKDMSYERVEVSAKALPMAEKLTNKYFKCIGRDETSEKIVSVHVCKHNDHIFIYTVQKKKGGK